MTNKNLKKFLVASSMLAGLALGAAEAGAVVITTSADPGTVINGGNTNLSGAWSSGDDLKLGGVHAVNITGVTDVHSIDLNSKAVAAKAITVSAGTQATPVTIGSIKDSGGGNTILLNINDGNYVKLTGTRDANNTLPLNDYSGLGNIKIGSAAAGTATLEVAVPAVSGTPAVFGGTINGDADHKGNLLVSGTYNTFNGVVGGTGSLASVNVSGANNTFGAAVKADAITVSGANNTFSDNVTLDAAVQANAVLNIATGGVMKVANGKTIDLSAAKGSITGAGTLTAVGDLTVQNFSAIGVSAAGTVTAPTITAIVSGKTLTLAPNANADIYSAITAADNTAKVVFNSAGGGSVTTIHKDIGTSATKFADVKLTVANDALVLDPNTSIHATTITFNHADASITLGDKSALNGKIVAGATLADAGVKGVIKVAKGAAATATNIDNTNAYLKEVQLGGDGETGVTATTFTVGTLNTTAAKNFGAQTIDFTRATDSTSQFVVDMTNLPDASSALTLKVGSTDANRSGVTTDTNSTAGAIVFKNNTKGNTITLATAGNSKITRIGGNGTNAGTLALLDATGSKLVLESNFATDEINIAQVKADQLTLKATNGAGSDFTIGGATLAGVTGGHALIVSADAKTITLKAGTNLGTVAGVQLTADTTLAFADGVNLTFTGNVVSDTANAAGKGVLSFAGTSTLEGSGTLGTQANPLKTITLGAANKTVTFGAGDIFVADAAGIKYSNNDTTGSMVINGNVHGNITTANNNTGIVTFNSASVVDGSVGTANGPFKLNTVNIGADVSVAKVTADSKYGATNTVFTKDVTLTVGDKLTATTADYSFGTVKTTAGLKTGTIQFNSAATINGNFGEDNAALKAIAMNQDQTLTIAGAATTIHSDLITTTDTKGTVVFNTGGAHALKVVGDIGSTSAAFKQVTFQGGAGGITVGNVYGKAVKIDAATVVTAQSVTSADATNGIQLNNAAAELVINEGGAINSLVTPGAAGHGKVTLTGAATIASDLGVNGGSAINTLTLNGVAADKTVTFKGKYIGLNGKLDQFSTLKLTQDTTMKVGGDYQFNNGAVLDIGANNLLLSGTVKNSASGMTIKVDNVNERGYFIKQAPGLDALTFNNGAAGYIINFNINEATNTGDFPGNGRLFNILVDNTAAANPIPLGAATRDAVRFTGNKFVKRTYVDNALATAAVGTPDGDKKAALTIVNGKAPELGEGYFTVDVNANDIVDPKATGNLPAANDLAAAFEDAADSDTLTGDAGKILLGLGAEKVTLADRTDAVNRLADQSAPAIIVNDAVSEAVGFGLKGQNVRIADLASAGMMRGMADHSDAVGVAAGDVASSEKFGVWANVMGSQATQKLRKNVSGYQSKTFGAMVGADTMLSDKALVGMVVGNTNANIKHKDAKAGDKTRTSSWLFGIYGSADIGETDFFVQGNFTVAQTAVKSKEARYVTTTAAGAKVFEKASSKYDILGYGAQVLGGYKYSFSNSYIIPSAGLGFNYFGDTSFTQTGTTSQNAKVTTKATSLISALVGVKFGTAVDMDGTTVMPEVHMNGSYALNSPSAKANFTLNGLSKTIQYKGPKAAKFAYNFGTSVMAQSDEIEYGIGYDADISDKYLAHQGALKFKVKF